MTPSPVLLQLLDEVGRLEAGDAESDAALLPAALVALGCLGVDDARLVGWRDAYVRTHALAPLGVGPGWPAGDAWTSRLGQAHARPMYRDLFAQWIAHEDGEPVLAQVLPALMPGCSAGAFAPLIGTAHAVAARHGDALADALAAWASGYQPLGPLPLSGSVDVLPASRSASAKSATLGEPDPQVLLRRLPRPGGTQSSHASPASGERRSTGQRGLRTDADRRSPMTESIAALARGGTINAAVAPLAIDSGTPERLSRAAALACARSGGVLPMRLLAATSAMRQLAAFTDDEAAAWRWFWQACAHAVVAARLQDRGALPPRSWAELTRAALAGGSAEALVFVATARDEEQRYGGDDWRRAATRVLAEAASPPN
ncbi:MAG TPA: questin oxidase family protein [Rubrivivax sp.]|nr:questin oxidase family protein [Burkholderiales bacterium]HNU09834.1 questin oxidase family protein [Rubrivivax sp.]